MSKLIQIDLEKLDKDYLRRIERRAIETNQSEEDIIVEMLKREDWIDRFRSLNQQISSYTKDMTEEEILSLPRKIPKEN